MTTNPCSIEGCERPVLAKGLCASHYQTQRMSRIRAEVRAEVRECRHCGKPFAGRDPRAVFCSRQCKDGFHDAERHLEVERRHTGRVCIQCGKPIPVKASGKAITCSRPCAIKYQNDKKQQAREAERAPRAPCAHCGEAIPDERQWGSKYCSFRCKQNAIAARWRERSPGYMRQYLYGVTPEQYDAMLEAQGGRCAICSATESGGKGGWHVDHCHDSKAVRGLLCHNCNLMLGNAKDDPARLRAAIAYLEKPLEG